jgi:folate-binding Fe-S cluster repair protein YgfZ
LDGSGGWITKLESRKIISIRGADSQSFLQGLMTQDINLFKKEGGTNRAALFTTFLNVKGKLLFDALLAKPLLAN